MSEEKCSFSDLLKVVGLTVEELRARSGSGVVAMIEGSLRNMIARCLLPRDSYQVSELGRYLKMVIVNSERIIKCKEIYFKEIVEYSESLMRDGLLICNKKVVVASFLGKNSFSELRGTIVFLCDENGHVEKGNRGKFSTFDRKIVGTIPSEGFCAEYIGEFFSGESLISGVPYKDIPLFLEVIHGVVSRNNLLVSLSKDGRVFIEGEILEVSSL